MSLTLSDPWSTRPHFADVTSGFVGAQLTQLLLDLFPKLNIITTDIIEPSQTDKRVKAVKADLGDVKQVEGLFEGQKIGGIFALQCVSFHCEEWKVKGERLT